MKILYQWALKNPTGWQEVDSSQWANLPSLPIPKVAQLGGLNNLPGWIRNVSVQGITNEGFDHIAIEPITIGLDEGLKMTSWNDDPVDYPVGERQAIVWIILPLAPDPKLGMAINTRQSCVRYCEGTRYDRLVANTPQNTTIRPWTEFVAPPDAVTRHGVWLTDAKQAEHVAIAPQAEWGWMHWCDHLPESETELETEITMDKVVKILAQPRRKLKEQRVQGRYAKPSFTITYYQRDTARAAGWITANTAENALELSTAASATQTATTTTTGLDRTEWGFNSPANEPNSADWPNGDFHFQFNCTAASAGVNYHMQTGFGFVRASSDLVSALENSTVLGSFSGTGLKLVTLTKDFTGGNVADRYGHDIRANGDSHGDVLTLQFNTTDSYADGPWVSGAAVFVPSPVLALTGAGV